MLKRGMFRLRVKRRNDKKQGYCIPLKPRTDTQGEPAVVSPAPPTVLVFCGDTAYPHTPAFR